MSDGQSRGDSQSLSLTTGGITLIGVLLSIGVTVGFGIKAELWIRIVAGLATSVGLIVGVKLLTRSGAGPLARIARWVISDPDPRDR